MRDLFAGTILEVLAVLAHGPVGVPDDSDAGY